MKKFLSLLCMITCIFGLTACGSSEVEYTEYEKYKIEVAKKYAVEYVVPSMEEFKDEELRAAYDEYTAEEIADNVHNALGIEADGYAFKTAIESFISAYDVIGEVKSIGEATARIDDKQIIVLVEVQGENQNAEAEVIFSNDKFNRLESAALNPEETMGDLMGKAAMNTVIGMGTVFAVLILISFIISCFGVIPKIQAKMSKKDKKEEVKPVSVAAPAAPVVAQEEVEELSDDLELVAVIAAAIAASEGAATTDGFVVRSIRKVRR